MMRFEEILFKIAIVFAVLVVVSKANEGYYWRNYISDLPDDALPATTGTDGKAQKVYIGVTVHPGFNELPGIIRPNLNKIFYEFGGKEYSTIENVKILCSLYPDQFRWSRMANGQLSTGFTRNGEELVPAGTDQGRALVVGRVVFKDKPEDEVVIAKLRIDKGKFAGVFIARDGVGGWGLEEAELLVYDPNVPVVRTQCDRKPVIINVFN